MTLLLTDEQARAVATQPNEPLELQDPATNEVFVLLRAEDYARVRPLLTDDFKIEETYPAQFAAALRAGWDDPKLDDYNNYDEAFAKLCQSQSSEAKSS